MTLHRKITHLAATFATIPVLLSASPFSPTQAISNYQMLQSRNTAQGKFEVVAKTAHIQKTMGYTDCAIPAGVEIPDNMKSWLDCVEQAAQYVNSHPEYTLGTASASSTVIAPLLGGIKWNQDFPYNNLCPAGTPVGCVATAMAQVLYYYQYPEHGFFSKSYNHEGTMLSADFENTYYQWDQMFDIYDGHTTSEQNHAVAELSYHCGISVNMSYAPGGSGAWLERVPYALKKYFGYNSKAEVRNRTNFTYEEWTEMLIEELQAGRPILFAAQSDDSGHCFVIDGINSEGYFHVNWGWGGYYNGYFDIGILNPMGTGIGGSASDDFGYCFGQGAVFQLCPEEGVGVDLCPISCNMYGFWYDMETGYKAGYTFQNNSGGSINATVGVEIYDEHDNSALRLPGITYDFGAYPSRGYWQWNAFDVTDLSALPDGTYTCGCYCQIPALGETYFKLDCCPADTKVWFRVENGMIVSYEEAPGAFNMTADNLNFEPGMVLAVGKIYDCTFDVTNLSQNTFVGMAYVDFVIYNDEGRVDSSMEFGSNDLKILPGQTTTVTIPVWVEEGKTWNFWIALEDYGYGRSNIIQFDGLETIDSEFTAESPAALVLMDTPQLLTERCEVDGDVAFEMTVDNQGGNFSGKIAMMLFPNKTYTENPTLTIEETQELAMTTTGNVLNITGKLSGLKGMTKYYARPFFQDQRGNYKQLLPASGKASPIEVKVFNATGIEEIAADPIDNAIKYDLMGRRIKGQNRGIRIEHNATSLR